MLKDWIVNKLSLSKRAQILHMLVEGNSLRATSRMADVSYNTVLSFLGRIGKVVSDYQDKALVNLLCKRLQVDEIWSFCYAKEKNVGSAKTPVDGAGSVWTWTALCPDTKLVPSWYVGDRDIESAHIFVNDLASRMSNRVQLTSDGHGAYLQAIENAFGNDIDYAMLVKIYGANQRYVGSNKQVIVGRPDLDNVSTSLVERQNLTMRMGMRRFTRKTNGFSKKIENHANAVSLHFMYYNFARIHKTLRVTPAMEAGISNHVWTIEEIVELEEVNSQSKPRGAYGRKKLACDLISN